MYTGRNLHYSPLDNKPLCSYSSKLCRQRRLNGFAFCIRHILEDKSAPYRRCGFVTRNNSQKCLNAIPSNQERGYCHSHMQVVGIIPKTERKTKVILSGGGGAAAAGNGTHHLNNKNASSVLSSSSSSSSTTGAMKIVHTVATNGGSTLGGGRDDQKSVSREVLIKQELNGQKVHSQGISSALSPSHCSTLSNNVSCKNPTTTTTFQTNKVEKPFQTTNTTTTSATISSNIGLKQPPQNNMVICGKVSSNNSNGKVHNGNVTSLQNSTTKHHTSTVESQATLFGGGGSSSNNNKEIRDRPKKASNNKASSTTTTTTTGGTNGIQSNIQTTNAKKKTLLSYSKASNSGLQMAADKSKSLVNKIARAPNNAHSQNNSIVSPVTTLCVRDRWKSFKFTPKFSDHDIKPAVQLEHMTSIKILEKLPLFEVANKIDDKNCVKLEGGGNKINNNNFNNHHHNHHHNSASPNPLPISSGIEILLVPPFLSTTKLYNVRRNKVVERSSTTTTEIMDKNEESFQSETQVIKKGTDDAGEKDKDEENNKNKILSNENVLLHPWETRKEFLNRVRLAFKRQYKIIRKASQLSERQDKSDRGFRQALLTCAMNDSSKCAQILVSSGDPKFEETTSNRGIKIESSETNIDNNSSNNNSNSYSLSPIIKVEKIPRKLKGKLPVSWKANHNNTMNNGFDSIGDPTLANDMNVNNDISNAKSANNSKISNSSNGNYLWSTSNGTSGHDSNNKKFKGSNKLSKSATNSDVNGNQSDIKSYANPNGKMSNSNKNSVNNVNNALNSKKKVKKPLSSPAALKTSFKKRKVDSVSNGLQEDLEFHHHTSNGQLDTNMVLHSSHDDLLNSQQLGVSSSADLQTNLENVLNSVSSSDAATTPEGVITDASFDSPFDSTSSQPDFEDDDDLENSFESFEPNLLGDGGCLIDPEIAHQAHQLLEDNGLTEDDFNELFPETRMGDHKLNGRADLNDLGIDFTSNSFDANDIDYSLFANIFPNFRSNQADSISVNHHF